jgi:hypothetical protein
MNAGGEASEAVRRMLAESSLELIGLRRPRVVAVDEHAAHVIVRRETEEDLLRLYP